MKWIIALWLVFNNGTSDGPFTNGDAYPDRITCEQGYESDEAKVAIGELIITVNKVLEEDGVHVVALRLACTQESEASNRP